MQESEDANTPKQLSREQRWQIVQTLHKMRSWTQVLTVKIPALGDRGRP